MLSGAISAAAASPACAAPCKRQTLSCPGCERQTRISKCHGKHSTVCADGVAVFRRGAKPRQGRKTLQTSNTISEGQGAEGNLPASCLLCRSEHCRHHHSCRSLHQASAVQNVLSVCDARHSIKQGADYDVACLMMLTGN